MWGSVTLRHVAEMALAVASVLTTVTVFTTIEGLLLVLIYVTFLVGSFVDIISMENILYIH